MSSTDFTTVEEFWQNMMESNSKDIMDLLKKPEDIYFIKTVFYGGATAGTILTKKGFDVNKEVLTELPPE